MNKKLTNQQIIALSEQYGVLFTDKYTPKSDNEYNAIDIKNLESSKDPFKQLAKALNYKYTIGDSPKFLFEAIDREGQDGSDKRSILVVLQNYSSKAFSHVEHSIFEMEAITTFYYACFYWKNRKDKIRKMYPKNSKTSIIIVTTYSNYSKYVEFLHQYKLEPTYKHILSSFESANDYIIPVYYHSETGQVEK